MKNFFVSDVSLKLTQTYVYSELFRRKIKNGGDFKIKKKEKEERNFSEMTVTERDGHGNAVFSKDKHFQKIQFTQYFLFMPFSSP